MARRTGRPAPVAGVHPITTGTAELRRDRDDPDCWMLLVNDVPSSWVNLADPADLGFEYLEVMRELLDTHRPPPERIDALHVGGAGCTLPRALAAARPRSRQVVAELDESLVELARTSLGLASVPGLRLRIADGDQLVGDTATESLDLLVRDAFTGDAVPTALTRTGFVTNVARALRPDGLYLANVADRPPLQLARAEVATAKTRFAHVALVAEAGVLRGRRYANLVLAASHQPLPVSAWTTAIRGGVVPMRLLAGSELTAFAAAAPIM